MGSQSVIYLNKVQRELENRSISLHYHSHQGMLNFLVKSQKLQLISNTQKLINGY